jgi:hypothetical protein
LSASVWPYLSFDTTISPGAIKLAVDNDGLGPAIVRDARMTIDGKPIATWRAAFKALASRDPFRTALGGKKRRLAIDERDIFVGSVIRPGVSSNIIDVHDKAIDLAGGFSVQRRIHIAICYCSILGRCWIADLTPQNDAPRDVGSCTTKGSALVF